MLWIGSMGALKSKHGNFGTKVQVLYICLP